MDDSSGLSRKEVHRDAVLAQSGVSSVCPVCGSEARSRWELAGWAVYQCQSKLCGCQFRVQNSNWEAGHVSEHARLRHLGHMDSPEVVLGRVSRKLHDLEVLGPGTRLLDIGSGASPLYPNATPYGAVYEAVEFDATARAAAQRDYGVEPFASLDEVPLEQKYDLIVLSEVIEHVPDPIALLHDCRLRLRPGGALYLSTPNAAGLRAQIDRKDWSSYQNSGHLLYFTPQAIEFALQLAGFQRTRRIKVWIHFPQSSLARRFAQALLIPSGYDGSLRYLANV